MILKINDILVEQNKKLLESKIKNKKMFNKNK
jgi:hypothetical protein